jgi:hypothetical protein
MYLNCDQVGPIRAKAVELVSRVLDFYRGDDDYKDVCKGYSPGAGTSCTFLPHWMLLNLGVSVNNKSKGVNKLPRGLINRTDMTRGTNMVPGDGVSVIVNSPDFVKTKAGLYPQSGDIVVIQSDPYKQSDEHVFVFLKKLSDTSWDTGESGQAASNAPNGTIEAKRKSRVMRISPAKMIAVASDGKPDRYVQGWLDLSQLDYVDGSVP